MHYRPHLFAFGLAALAVYGCLAWLATLNPGARPATPIAAPARPLTAPVTMADASASARTPHTLSAPQGPATLGRHGPAVAIMRMITVR